jgi:pimeloyl-ACP methyl ester carboxylesterase
MTAPPTRHVVDANGIPVSALLCEAVAPRAVIVALHGGAARAAYFDAPGQPRLSLLRTGAALGFTVIALDRPGYGSSAGHARELAPAARRAGVTAAAVDRLLAGRPRGAGVFLLGHSMGCALALQLAAGERGTDLLGLEIAGTGRHLAPRAAAILGTRMTRGQAGGTAVRDLIWGPDHLYPAGAAAGLYSPSPGYERAEVQGWPQAFPRLAARVRIPVRCTIAEHEQVWQSGPAALADIAGLFAASPRVVAGEQPGAGHNLSRGLAAAAYHLKVLSFAEECVLAREHSNVIAIGTAGAAPAGLAGG